MATSAKVRKGKALTPAEKKKLQDATQAFKELYADILSMWAQCTPEQKKAYLADSPILAELLNWSEQWRQ